MVNLEAVSILMDRNRSGRRMCRDIAPCYSACLPVGKVPSVVQLPKWKQPFRTLDFELVTTDSELYLPPLTKPILCS